MGFETFAKWFGNELERRNLNASSLGRMIGWSDTAVRLWLKGESTPSERACDAIANAWGMDHNEVRRLAGRPESDHSHFVSSSTQADLTFNARGRGETRAGLTTNPPVESQPIEFGFLPIIGTAAADELRAVWGQGNHYPVIRGEFHGISRARLLVVSGHCMEPTIKHGDLVVVDIDATPAIGNVVVVRMGDDVTLKEYWSDDGNEIILRPRDPAFETIRISKEDQGAALVGVVKRVLPASYAV